MKKRYTFFAIVIVVAIFTAVSMAQDSFLGEWLFVQRSRGGLGSTKSYSREGTVTVTYGALVDFTYKVAGNKLTLSFPSEADVVQNSQIEGNKLILTDPSGRKQELTRLSGNPESGIVGQWMGDHYTGQKQILHFTNAGNLYLSVPMVSTNGSYEINGDLLTESFESKGKKEWKWAIKDNLLALTDSAGRTETYVRKK